MSGDWRGTNRSPHPQRRAPAKESPFMRTAYGYSTPEPPVAPPVVGRNLPQLSPSNNVGYQAERKSTPTSVLLPVDQVESQIRGKLLTIQGEQRGETWFLNRSHTSLGRALDNDIVLLDIAASRKHAQVIRSQNGFALLDLRSANGIFINGRRVTEEELYDGDEIEIGETILRFETVGQPRVRENLDEDDTDPGMSILPPIPSPPQPDQMAVMAPVHQQPHIHSAQTPLNKGKSEHHLTYGFGSKWSPNELNLSQERQNNRRFLPSKKEKLYDLINQVSIEMKIGQGRRANVIRTTVAMILILLFFGAGQVLSGLLRSLPSSSVATKTQSTTSPTNDLGSAASNRENQQNNSDQIFEELTILVSKRDWRPALQLYSEQVIESAVLTDSRIAALKAQAEQGLLNEVKPLARESIQRGVLSKAKKLLDETLPLLSDEKSEALASLQFSLWLHTRELGAISSLNPPPREQRVLERSAREIRKGNYRNGLKILKRAKPGKQRRKLFELRQKSIKLLSKRRRNNQTVYNLELHNLLGDSFDTQKLLQRYRAAIEQGVRKTQYQKIAPWLEGAILLSQNQPQLNQYLIDTQIKLKSEAIKWLNIAMSSQNRSKKGLNRALLEAAIPYLEGSSLKQAKLALRQLNHSYK